MGPSRVWNNLNYIIQATTGILRSVHINLRVSITWSSGHTPLNSSVAWPV
ncbi:unnamed protein product, partial [Callosobruchus maculatus]